MQEVLHSIMQHGAIRDENDMRFTALVANMCKAASKK